MCALFPLRCHWIRHRHEHLPLQIHFRFYDGRRLTSLKCYRLTAEATLTFALRWTLQVVLWEIMASCQVLKHSLICWLVLAGILNLVVCRVGLWMLQEDCQYWRNTFYLRLPYWNHVSHYCSYLYQTLNDCHCSVILCRHQSEFGTTTNSRTNGILYVFGLVNSFFSLLISSFVLLASFFFFPVFLTLASLFHRDPWVRRCMSADVHCERDGRDLSLCSLSSSISLVYFETKPVIKVTLNVRFAEWSLQISCSIEIEVIWILIFHLSDHTIYNANS